MTVLSRPAVSVVASCFDEEDVLPEFLSRLGGVLDSLGGTSELVLADDGYSDGTWEIIEKAGMEDSRVVGGVDISVAATEPASPPLPPTAQLSAEAGCR